LTTHLNGRTLTKILVIISSEKLRLAPDDIILTGTPDGIVNVGEGDEVICEIDGLGRLINTIASDSEFGLAS